MNYILRAIKNFFLWSYARNTWQWDVLCVVILIFIFLSPKSWFTNGERQGHAGHQTQVVSTVILGPEVIDNEKDRVQIEDRVRALTGRTNAQVVDVRPRRDKDGRTVGYEVDIR